MEKFCISRDPKLYEAWPDVVLTPSGKLVAVFCECTHHGDRSYSRIMLTDSVDRGRTWSPRRPLTEATGPGEAYWNCPRILPAARREAGRAARPGSGRKGERLQFPGGPLPTLLLRRGGELE